MGQGLSANRKKNPPESIEVGCALARQSRGLLPPYRQHQLPAHDCALHHVAARDDRALLSRLDSDVGDRSAAVPRFHVFHLQLLSRRAKRASSQNMAAHVSLHALRHGHGDRHFRAQRASSDRSAARQEKRIRPHAQIQYRRQAGRIRDKIVPEQSRLDALRGDSFRLVLLFDGDLRHPQRKLRHRPVPVALRLGLPLHGRDVPRPNLLRASAFRSQRPGDAPRHFRRPGLLNLLIELTLRSAAFRFSRVRCRRQSYTARKADAPWNTSPSRMATSACMRSLLARKMAPSSFCSTAFLNSGIRGTDKSSRCRLQVFASSCPTSAATTSAANPSASLRMPCLSSFPTSSPSPINSAREKSFSPDTIGAPPLPRAPPCCIRSASPSSSSLTSLTPR